MTTTSNNKSNEDFRKALDSENEITMTFVGRKTGKKFSIPIWFVKNGDKLYFLPVGGTKSKWYRNIVKNPTIEIRASGKQVSAKTRPTQDKKVVDDVMNGFRSKYGTGDVKRYYPGQNAAVELSI